MSRSLNQVTLVGNLTRDPELRATPSGDEVCQFSLALNRSYRTRDGDEVAAVDYVDVAAWGGLAKVVKDYCHKGKQILVAGSLRSSSWEQDGQKRSKLEVVANNIILLGGRADNLDNASPQSKETDSKKNSGKKAKSKSPAEEVVDYELDADYELEGMNPEDIPF